jgi:hypothetical protein
MRAVSTGVAAARPRSPGHPTDTPIPIVVSLRSMPVLQRCRFSHFQANWCRDGRERDDLVIRCSDGLSSLGSHPTGVNRTRKARFLGIVLGASPGPALAPGSMLSVLALDASCCLLQVAVGGTPGRIGVTVRPARRQMREAASSRSVLACACSFSSFPMVFFNTTSYGQRIPIPLATGGPIAARR